MKDDYRIIGMSGVLLSLGADTVFSITFILYSFGLLHSIKNKAEKQMGFVLTRRVLWLITAYLIWDYAWDVCMVAAPQLIRSWMQHFPIDPICLVYPAVCLLCLQFLNKHYQQETVPPVAAVPEHVAAIDLDELAVKFGLTLRERELVTLVAQGLSNPDISERLFISTNTVKRHMNNIYRKIGIKSRYELLHLLK